VVAFLDRGVDIDARTNDGWTALHAAVRFDTCEGIAGILLNRGADVKVRDKSGWTTLHYLACFGGAENILHELTRRGVDINQEDIRGRRAVYYATRHGNNFLRIFLGAQMAHDSKLQSEFSLDDEIGTYKLFCHLCPGNVLGHLLLGDANGKQDMFSEASSSYDKFIETNPRNRVLPGVDDIYHSVTHYEVWDTVVRLALISTCARHAIVNPIGSIIPSPQITNFSRSPPTKR
jgi:hypothetical protein